MNSKKYYWRNYPYAPPVKWLLKFVSNTFKLNSVQKTKLRYLITFRKSLNLEKPQRFSEKIQYLKIKGNSKELSKYVDKYEVRDFVKERIGGKYLNELINVYLEPKQIDFSLLPDKFVLKLTHSSKQNIICTDKSKLNIDKTCSKLTNWLNVNYGELSGELPYKHVTPRIICEKYLGDSTELFDYKFFCFNGNPEYVQVDMDRFEKHTRNFYNLNWEIQPFRLLYPKKNTDLPKPENFDEMKELASILSNDFPFSRIDFFNVQGKIFFGEITFYPGNGFEYFLPNEYDRLLGDRIHL